MCGGLYPCWSVWGWSSWAAWRYCRWHPLGGAWGSVLCCRKGSCTVVRVCLVGGVGLRGGASVVENMLASFRMASMVWAPKRAKGEAGAGFARVSARCLAASVAVSAEDMAGMAPLWGKNWKVLVMRYPERRRYLWGGFCVGGSTLGGRSGGGRVGQLGGTAGGTL